MKIVYIIYLLIIAVLLIFSAIFSVIIYTLPSYIKLRKKGITTIRDNISTISDAIAYLQDKGLKEWELVKEAQKLVCEKMEYSRRNNWDSSERAFARGMGYCQQQAEALLIILKSQGIDARLVQCMKNKFPPKKIHEYYSQGGMCGHVWLRVKIANEEKDVCPGNINNEPGIIHFIVIGKVTNYSGIMKVLGNLGSALMNIVWDKAAKKKMRNMN